MEKSSSTTHKSETASFPHYNVIVTLLAISIILSLVSLSFMVMGNFSQNSDKGETYNTIMGIEYEKVGGKENYDLLHEANVIQLEQQLPQIKEYIQANSGTGGTTTTQTADQDTGTFTQDEVANLLKDAYIEGNADANIVFIEYSDMECPFCIRQEVETKPYDAIQAAYPDAVSHIFKNNRGVNHSGTEKKALGALCAGKLGGTEAYAGFYHAVFADSTLDSPVAVSKLPEIAGNAGVDVDTWQACVDNQETLDRFTAETSEAESLGLTGTPGNLLLNKTTGAYVKISGAYPADTFLAAIEKIK